MNKFDRYLAAAKAELDENGFQRICVHSEGNNDTTEAEIEEYQTILDSATNEKPLQKYLESHPGLIIDEWEGQCHWVIPQKRLGSELVPDFVVARLDSPAIVRWTLIELQNPTSPPFKSNGHWSAQLTEGYSQIQSWRRWLEDNGNYARNKRARNGLGLKDISSYCGGLILVGRTAHRDEDAGPKLIQFKHQNNIEVHSYDWLARQAASRIQTRADLGCWECTCC